MRVNEIPPHLHARYGIRPKSPWRWVGLGVVLVFAVPSGLYAASRYVATQRIPFALISWSAESSSSVHVLWKLDANGQRQWCALSAQDFDHYDVGFAVVPVPVGATSMTYDLNVTERPLAVEIAGCANSPYDLAGPQFPPGVLPPAQPTPGFAPGIGSLSDVDLR